MLVTDAVYGPTRRFCDLHLQRLGVDVTYYDPLLGARDRAASFKPNTRLVFVESPGSLTFEVQDVPRDLPTSRMRTARSSVLDNTWATPLYFRAFDHGVDVSVHAATKYIGGHSDVLLGVIVASASDVTRRCIRLWTDMGITASSDDCFLGLRGLRTLATRLDRSRRARLRIAQWLRERPEVKEVLHPGLPGARGHELWKRDFRGATSLFGVVLQPVSEDAHRRDARRPRAVFDGLQLGRLREPHHPDVSGALAHARRRGRRAGRACGLRSGSRIADDLIADLAARFRAADRARRSRSSPRYTACTRGSARTASGVPSAMILPRSSTITRSAKPNTTSMSCSVNSTAMPSRRARSAATCISAARERGAMPAVGSSISSRRGLPASASASSTRLASP